MDTDSQENIYTKDNDETYHSTSSIKTLQSLYGSIVLRRTMSRRYYNTEKYAAALTDQFECPSTRKRDVIIVGGGHNGLVAAAYLAKQGLDVLVLERRHIVGGAAVTEEIVPDFKFSRASYLAGLLRNSIIEDSSWRRSMTLGIFRSLLVHSDCWTFFTRKISDHGSRWMRHGKVYVSERDGDAFVEYEQFLDDS